MPAHRIAYVSTTSELGGAEISLTTLIGGLDRDRFDPVVALPMQGPLFERLEGLGVPVHIVPMETRRRRHPVAFWRTQRGLARWICDVGADLVHVNSFWAPEFAVPAAKHANRPVVYHCRDFYPHLDPVRLRAFRQCDALIAISQSVLDTVLQHDPLLPVELIHNPVNLDLYDRDSPACEFRNLPGWENAQIVGIASRISPEKGQLEFVRAMRKVADHYLTARFLIVGGDQFTHSDDYHQKVREEADRLGITDRLHFTGFVDSMPPVFKAMDVCVLASLSEPFGRIIIEAMAAGTAVVATCSGGPQEIITHGVNGILVEPGNVDEISTAVLALLNNPGQRHSLATEGRRLVEREYSLEQVRCVEALYSRVLSGVNG